MDLHNDSDHSDASDEVVASLTLSGNLPGIDMGGLSDEEEAPSLVRSENKKRAFAKCDTRFDRLYFSKHCGYEEKDFERRFRMPRFVFERVLNALQGRSLFVQRQDATTKRVVSPRMRLNAALRVLAYGKSFDKVDEICEQSSSSVRESFFAFTNEIVNVFGAEYLRNPRAEDLRRIMGINAQRGFTGCVGSFDCQKWEWKNCPVAWAGQFKGKEKKPTVVLEAIADGELWIWGCHFGKPGSMNDINVIDTSPIVTDILQGNYLPDYEFRVNGNIYKHLYLLVDGIYPHWSIFVSTISEGATKKEKLFASAQEAMRKDVERGFGVFISRWALLAKPCTLWERDRACSVIKCAIILHNMIVEARRDGYDSELQGLATEATMKGFYLDGYGVEKEFRWHTRSSLLDGNNTLVSDERWAMKIASVDNRIKDEVRHFALKKDLVDNIWNEHSRV